MLLTSKMLRMAKLNYDWLICLLSDRLEATRPSASMRPKRLRRGKSRGNTTTFLPSSSSASFFFRRGFCYCHGWLYFTFLPERHVLNTLELCYKFHFKSVPCSITLVIMCPVSFICLYHKQLGLDLKFPSNRLKMNSISCSFIRY